MYNKDFIPKLDTFSHTCGLINSRHHFEQSEGYFEGRIKGVKGNGYWPAFWLMTGDSWPPEIDIFEMKGSDPHLLHFAHHYKTSQKSHDQHSHTIYDIDFSEDFHIFAVEWNKKEIKWYVDGVLKFTSKKNIPTNKMYFILSSAIGGDWSGYTDSSTPATAYFEADYVRAYRKIK